MPRRKTIVSDDDDDDLVMSDIREVRDAQMMEAEDMEMPDVEEEEASTKARGKKPASNTSDPGKDRGDDGKMFMVAVESTSSHTIEEWGVGWFQTLTIDI